MFKLFFLYIFTCFPLWATDSINQNQAKSTDFIQQRIPGKLYISQKEKGLWFVAERLDGNNSFFWKDYVSDQLEFRRAIERGAGFEKFRTLASYAEDGLGRFQEMISFRNSGDLWVIYAYTSEHFPTLEERRTDHIEMAFILLTTPESPFSSHMGISRGMVHLYFSQKQPQNYPSHRNISVDLHAFSARFVQEHYLPAEGVREKKWMITVPIKGMYEILMKSGLPSDAVHLGDNDFRDNLMRLTHEYEQNGGLVSTIDGNYFYDLAESDYLEYKTILDSLNKHPSIIHVTHSTRNIALNKNVPDDFRWILYDKPEGDILLEVTKDNYQNYSWFFGNPGSQPNGVLAFYVAVNNKDLANLYKGMDVH